MDMLSSPGRFSSCEGLLDFLLNLDIVGGAVAAWACTCSVYEPYYQYVFTGHMPEGWQIEHGIAAPWESECGGVRQLRVLDQTGRPMKISELNEAGVLKGAEVPVGF